MNKNTGEEEDDECNAEYNNCADIHIHHIIEGSNISSIQFSKNHKSIMGGVTTGLR